MKLVALWILIALYGISIPLMIMSIGKPREPRTNGEVAIGVVLVAVQVVLLLMVAGVIK